MDKRTAMHFNLGLEDKEVEFREFKAVGGPV